ncbi:hypothetical protein ACH47B_06515 [Rhodococcus sp. NPDC019627]|uniref:hypothetical protein n=1 Tax=unclassified Rhodococcus (in: high G+C Gram-positive bacteria) TaxID=192944 RepID=UPI00378983FC
MSRVADGFIPGGSTILQYVSPDGVVLYLAGGRLAGTQGFELGAGADGHGHVDVEHVFEKSARGLGERHVGDDYSHAEIDLPIKVSGSSVDEYNRRRDWLRELIPRDRFGYLCAYTNALGWRWIPTLRGSLKPALNRDPAGTNSAVFDVLFLAPNPLSRAADHVPPEWRNVTGKSTASGSLNLYPGREIDGWPTFILTGPGALSLKYAGNDVKLPAVLAGEVLRIDTTFGAQTLRTRRLDGGPGRNLWPLMKGQQFAEPVPAKKVTKVSFQITGASSSTKLWAMVPRWQEGLV